MGSRQGGDWTLFQRPLVPALPRLHAAARQVLRLDQGLQELRSYFRVERPRRVAVQGVLRRAGGLGGAAVQGPSDEERSVQEVQGTGHSYTRDPRRQDGRDHHARWPRRRLVGTRKIPLEAAVRRGHPLGLAALRRQGGRGGVVVGAARASVIVLLGALVPALPGVYAQARRVFFGAREAVSGRLHRLRLVR